MQLGIDAQIWYLPQADRPAGRELYTWFEVPKTDLVEFCQSASTRLVFSNDTLESTTKCDGSIQVSSYGNQTISVTCDFPWEVAMPNAEDFWLAAAAQRNVAAAVLDSSLFIDDTPPNLTGTFLGVWSDWLVLDWNHTHPLRASQRVSFRMVPAWSGYVDTVPTVATVKRAFTEILSPSVY